MRITSLRIENFRGIRYAHTPDLGGTVIIAGQNGSGKSCLFDAIRLLKSVYGGYQQNEWQQWLGEFQINVNSRAEELQKIFNDPAKQLVIEATFELDDDEKAFVTKNAPALVEEYIWRTILYGYLRIRNSAPRFSIILLDEPELHLNPRLIRGLPQFYRKHLGEALQNQIWLVSHSDALLIRRTHC